MTADFDPQQPSRVSLQPFTSNTSPPFLLPLINRSSSKETIIEFVIRRTELSIRSFNGQIDCDAYIVLNGCKIGVHSYVLDAQTDWFTRAFKNHHGHYFRNARDKTVDLSEEGEEVVRCMIEYLYTGQYYAERCVTDELVQRVHIHFKNRINMDGFHIRDAGFVDVLVLHTRMWQLADMIDIPVLRRYAREQFETYLDTHIPILGGSVFDVIRAAYANTRDKGPQSIRALVLAEASVFPRQDLWAYREEFSGLLDEVPEFAADLAWTLSGSMTCARCQDEMEGVEWEKMEPICQECAPEIMVRGLDDMDELP